MKIEMCTNIMLAGNSSVRCLSVVVELSDERHAFSCILVCKVHDFQSSDFPYLFFQVGVDNEGCRCVVGLLDFLFQFFCGYHLAVPYKQGIVQTFDFRIVVRLLIFLCIRFSNGC